MWEWITTEISADYLTAIGTFAIAVTTLILAVAKFCLASVANGWKSQWQADAEKDLAQRLLAAWTEFWLGYIDFHTESTRLVKIIEASQNCSRERKNEALKAYSFAWLQVTKPYRDLVSLLIESQIICGHSFEDRHLSPYKRLQNFSFDCSKELSNDTDIDETKRDELLERFEGFRVGGGQADDPSLLQAKFYKFITESYSIHKPQSKLSWFSKLKIWPSKNKMV